MYIAILYLPPIPVNLLKNAPMNIAMLILTNIQEMHCLKWRICMNTNININIGATSLMR